MGSLRGGSSRYQGLGKPHNTLREPLSRVRGPQSSHRGHSYRGMVKLGHQPNPAGSKLPQRLDPSLMDSLREGCLKEDNNKPHPRLGHKSRVHPKLKLDSHPHLKGDLNHKLLRGPNSKVPQRQDPKLMDHLRQVLRHNKDHRSWFQVNLAPKSSRALSRCLGLNQLVKLRQETCPREPLKAELSQKLDLLP